MKRLTIFSLTCLFSMGAIFAQQGVTQCGVPTGQPKFPLLTYQELPDPTALSDKEWAAVTSTQVSWGTTDVRYAKHQLPQLKKQQTVSASLQDMNHSQLLKVLSVSLRKQTKFVRNLCVLS